MAALINAAADDDFPAEIALVISNRADAPGLQKARASGVPTLLIESKPFGKDRAAFEAALQPALDQHGIELICLAGFMRLFTAAFVQRWYGRMLNIHPSLLPSFPGLDPHGKMVLNWIISLILYGVGSYPSTLVHMARNFPLGKIVQNSVYTPSKPSTDLENPAIMTFDRLSVSFPTKQVEWMEQPLYGGLVKETMQAEYLLTAKESKISHPYLQESKAGKVRWQGKSWYYRYFVGTTPKDALTGPGMGPETR